MKFKYKFLEKNPPNSLQTLDQEIKPQEKPFFEYESEKTLIHQKINNKPNVMPEEKKDKELVKPVKLYKNSNLQFEGRVENFEKENDDSLDDIFLKTLEKNDINFLRKSLMKFNMKESLSNENSKKYNNNGSYYPDDFENDEENEKDEIPELIEANTMTTNLNFKEANANFSFSQSTNNKKSANLGNKEIQEKKEEKVIERKERIQSANNVDIFAPNQIKRESENKNPMRKTSENLKSNLNSNIIISHASPKVCKNIFSEKFAINKKEPSTSKIESPKQDEKSRNLDKIVKKIEKLDEFKRSQLEKLLDKIEEGSLELESLVKFDFAPKAISKPEIHIIEDYQPFVHLPQENILIIKPLSSWNNQNLIGLTEIRLLDKSNQIIPISINGITLKNANISDSKTLKNLINGCNNTIDESEMWTCTLPKFPLCLEIQITIPKNFELGGVKIWNFNKNTIEIAKGVKDCEVLYNGSLKWKGIIKRGTGINSGLDYGEEIRIDDNFVFKESSPSDSMDKLSQRKKNSDMPKVSDQKPQANRKFSSNFDSEPNLNRKIFDLQSFKDKTSLENGSILENKKKALPENANIHSSQPVASSKILMTHPKTPLPFEDKPPTLKKSAVSNLPLEEKPPILKKATVSNLETPTQQIFPRNQELTAEKPKPKKVGSRFENNKEYLENYCPKSKFFDSETDFTTKKETDFTTKKEVQQSTFNPLDTLKYFNLNNEARLIKPQPVENQETSITKSLLKDFDAELDGLDFFFQKNPSPTIKPTSHSERKTSNVNDFTIPTLPSGRYMSIAISTTWGDPYYVGLSGLEIFDSKGERIKLKTLNQLKANPPDINILPEYGNDPRTIDKLMDGVNMTCDDFHVWLAPFTRGKENFIDIDIGANIKVSMIRIWNYNKSRIHSFRGAKDIKISLDDKLIFNGEIKKAPGTLKNSEKFCEYIMFTQDEAILRYIEKNDWVNNEIRSLSPEDDIEEILNNFERPKTATKFFDEKEMKEIQEILKIGDHKQDLLGLDGRPLTLALAPPRNMNVAQNEGKPKEKIMKKTIKVKSMIINLLDSWGDKYYMGLCGFEIYDGNQQKIPISTKILSAKPRDLNSTPGYQGDPRVLENLIDPENVTLNDKKMWLIPFVQGLEHAIFLNFQNETLISGMKFWNYNKSIEDLNRGVKLISIKADGNYVTPKEGILLRKAPGNKLFDFGHFIGLPYTENLEEKKILIESKLASNPSKRINQQYETPIMPMGFVVKLIFLTTWGDPHYIGLNGIEIYDGKGEPLLTTGKKEFKIVADPSSINILKGNEKDVRTVDKLINGKNNSYDERNMWLAPYVVLPQKGGKELNTIYFSFSSPILISNINIWNYTKTPKRGVKELEIYLDECLIFKGVIRKAPLESDYVKGQEIVTSILFTKNNEIIQLLKPIPYNIDNNDVTYNLINEKKVIKASNVDDESPNLDRKKLTERPMTGIRGNP